MDVEVGAEELKRENRVDRNCYVVAVLKVSCYRRLSILKQVASAWDSVSIYVTGILYKLGYESDTYSR